MRSRKKLRSYQRYLSDTIVGAYERRKGKFDKAGLLAAAEMGLGKTGATLDALSTLLNRFLIRGVLIVGPLRVAETTWPDEFREWVFTLGLTYSVMVGTPEERLAALRRDVDIHIINRENLPWLWRTIKGLKGWRWEVLVYDESSRLKGFTRRTAGGKKGSKLSEFGVLAAARPAINLILELTGTPATKGVYNLGGQIFLIDGGKRLGVTKAAFEREYFDKNDYTKALIAKPDAEKRIMTKVKSIMIGLRSQDYIDTPPIIPNDIYIDLTPKLQRQYKEFEREQVLVEHDIAAVNRGVLVNKLLQFANGHLYKPIEGTEPPKREVIKLHDLKLNALESIVEEACGQPMMLAYSFKFDAAAIKKRFPWATLFDEESNAVEKWNKGKIELLLAHPQSIGHGLNLQFGGHIQVWYGLTWSLENYLQFNKRLARSGQPHPFVTMHRILARGTYDEIQAAALNEHNITQDRLTEIVRVRLLQSAMH